jgi:transcriptional regulator ATRX
MQEADPYHWSPGEAAGFLRQHQFLSFADQLFANDLNGRMLLEDVNLAVLKDEFDNLPLKERICIMQVVRALRKSSSAYTESIDPTTMPSVLLLPTPHPSGPQTPVTTVGSNVRKGETLAEDTGGRKRRRLELVPVSDAPGASPSKSKARSDSPEKAVPKDMVSGYLRDKKLTVDDIFYGDTAYGSQVTHAGPDYDDDEESFDNFTIIGQSSFSGNASFVHRHLQRAFRRSTTQSITYHRKPAVAVYPYAERAIKDKDARSVTIFQPSGSGDAVNVIREKAQTLSFQEFDSVDTRESPGEFDFMLNKYQGGELMPKYGDSDSDSVSVDKSHDIGDSESESGSDDSMAEEDSIVEASPLSNEAVVSLVDKIIGLQAQAWRDNKQPKLDRKKARSVWRFARGNRKTVQVLTAAADKAIALLNNRLDQLRARFTLDCTWTSEQELEQSCLILEPTVHDREHEEWKKQIWALKTEPAIEQTERRPSNKNSHHLLKPENEDELMDDFILEDESFEDARESLSDNGHSTDVDSEPDLNSQAPLSPGGLGDEAVMPDEFDDEDTSMMVDEAIPDETEVPEIFEHNDEDIDMSRRLSIGSEPPDVPMLDEKPMETPSVKKNIIIEDVESPGLPTMAALWQQNSQLPKMRRGSPIIIIDSSPIRGFSSPKKQTSSPLKKIKPEFSDNPLTDSAADIVKWSYEDLEENMDRLRLMIKIVNHLAQEQRDVLTSLLTGNMTTCLKKVKSALATIKHGQEIFPEYNVTETEAMRYAARIYLCYSFIDHTLFSKHVHEVANAMRNGWDADDNDEDFTRDLRQWHSSLWKALQKYNRAERLGEHEAINLISDEDELDNSDEPPISMKRKRKVKRDESAVKIRAKAVERSALYESQNQTSQGRLFMAGENGDNHIPLYAPDDVDPSEHVYLNPSIAKRLKPHQIEGVKFMWREITAEEEPGEAGQGCLLAHTMGLGKTAQSLALLTAVAETAKDATKRKVLPKDLRCGTGKRFRALILFPPNLLQNWKQEIKIWCPPGLFEIHTLSSEITSKDMRLIELRNWKKQGGIMLCGYNMFTRLVNGKMSKLQAFSGAEQDEVVKMLLHKSHIVVADEVHSIKSDVSKTSLAAHRIKTQRRIGLTGSPMSNNTSEIFALINWVAPKFLGNKAEFKTDYQDPIEDGTYVDSTRWQIRKSMTKLAALKQIISPKLNRADITVLKGTLKSKVEFVLTIPLTEPQRLGYEAYVREILRGKAGEEGTTITQVKLFGWLAILQLLCNHPKVFRNKLLEPPVINKKGKKAPLLAAEDEVVAGPSTAPPSTMPASTAPPLTAATPGAREGQTPPVDEEAAYADAHISQYDINKAIVDNLLEVVPDDASIELSYKTLLVQKIMRLSIEAGDKVLIFSQSIPSLDFLDVMLTNMRVRYARIQGNVTPEKRERTLRSMKAGNLDVLLISTRAGGLGLNIQQANRVIIFDYSFNPTWEEQAIGRAYRLGQTKPVFVYRFVAGGTFEFSMYDKQLFKTGLTSRVVDKKNPMRNANKKPAEWMKPPAEVVQQSIGEEAGKDEHVMDKIIASHEDGEDSFIRSIRTMETLMGEANDEALTAEEMLEVQNEVLLLQNRKKAGFESRPILAPPPPPGAGPVPTQALATEPDPTPFSYRPFDRDQAAAAAQERMARNRATHDITDLTVSPKMPSRIVGKY